MGHERAKQRERQIEPGRRWHGRCTYPEDCIAHEARALALTLTCGPDCPLTPAPSRICSVGAG